MWIIVVFILSVCILASIVPFAQFLAFRKRKLSLNQHYRFSNDLFDYDIDNKGNNRHVDRFALSNRGWIRCPNGIIMSNETFEEKRNNEYKIDLP